MKVSSALTLVAAAGAAIAVIWASLGGAWVAFAANGDFVGEVHFSQNCASGIGVGVAYDGAGHLWVSCFASNPDLLRANATTGVVDKTYNIAGDLGALAYDAGRNGLWAAENGTVYFIQLDNTLHNVVASTVMFAPGADAEGLVDGVAFDSSDQTLYFKPDNSNPIHHYTVAGTKLPDVTGAISCAGPNTSGLAIGGDLLYEGKDGCSHVFVVNKKTQAPAFDFPTTIASDPNHRDEGLSCDTQTYANNSIHVMWSKEAYSPNRAAAFQIPFGTCGVGGAAALAITTSYYVETLNPRTMYDLGCQLGTNDRNVGGPLDDVVVLDFGAPRAQTGPSGTVYGSSVFVLGFADTGQIASASEAYASGYYNCAGSNFASHLRLVLGTSNNGSQVTPQHAQAWGQMVNTVATDLANKRYSGQVDVAGGTDLELGWNSPAVTRAWVDGYASTSQWYLYNYGDAAGCPPFGACGTSAFPSWTQEDVWYQSWGAAPSWPLPEVYTTDGGLASQWANLALYSVTKHASPMIIAGILTQHGACQVVTCTPVEDNTPQQARQQLTTDLNADPRTATNVRWSTDITWGPSR